MSYGRVRTRLAEMLSKELGVPVSPSDISPVTGYWRTSRYADVMRWEGFVTIDGLSRSIGSWDTMTDCVRRGIVGARELRSECAIMIYAKG